MKRLAILSLGVSVFLLVQAQSSCFQDTDGDGVPDGQDNCPEVVNPVQNDTDNDGIGDLCDTLESCKAILDAYRIEQQTVDSGTFTIDPDGDGEDTRDPFEVYCDMETDGGGWTRIDHAIARSLGTLSWHDGRPNYGSSSNTCAFDSDGKPKSGPIAYPETCRLDIALGFEFGELYIEDFQLKGMNGLNGNTSEMRPESKAAVWSGDRESSDTLCWGYWAFGDPSKPALNFTDLSGMINPCTDCTTDAYTSDPVAVNQADTVLRMEWDEGCGEVEGWKWNDGFVFVR